MTNYGNMTPAEIAAFEDSRSGPGQIAMQRILAAGLIDRRFAALRNGGALEWPAASGHYYAITPDMLTRWIGAILADTRGILPSEVKLTRADGTRETIRTPAQVASFAAALLTTELYLSETQADLLLAIEAAQTQSEIDTVLEALP